MQVMLLLEATSSVMIIWPISGLYVISEEKTSGPDVAGCKIKREVRGQS